MKKRRTEVKKRKILNWSDGRERVRERERERGNGMARTKEVARRSTGPPEEERKRRVRERKLREEGERKELEER